MKRNVLEKLQAVLPVPSTPIDVDEAFLRINQASIGTRLPDDYVAFGRIYGSGTIRKPFRDQADVAPLSYDPVMEIRSAFHAGLPAFVNVFRYAMTEYRKACETYDVPLGIFPEAGGLLPFASLDGGVAYYAWRTIGSPNDWTVVVIVDYEANRYECWDMSFTEFVLARVTKRIQLSCIEDWEGTTHGIAFWPTAFLIG